MTGGTGFGLTAESRFHPDPVSVSQLETMMAKLMKVTKKVLTELLTSVEKVCGGGADGMDLSGVHEGVANDDPPTQVIRLNASGPKVGRPTVYRTEQRAKAPAALK
ncbi:hypothetical protein PI124_g20729 [Phytophthora idaei]|nr:hypothetical protein PI125_g20951 [Phytophthora idaei]KAG3134848.1 hypothetical protein PI126_g18518 [Phytophthora idaei]KAG3234214.1 hypothetical protein PI124_g20729 [Phytophthora idaei]